MNFRESYDMIYRRKERSIRLYFGVIRPEDVRLAPAVAETIERQCREMS